MNNDINIAFGLAVGLMLAVFAAIKIAKFRRAFLVPEGYAGLLYQRGKFLEVFHAGEHVRWGRKFTLGVADLRKTSLLVAGQEVLTSDNVGIKTSLLVTYQVTDPVIRADARVFFRKADYTEPTATSEKVWDEDQLEYVDSDSEADP